MGQYQKKLSIGIRWFYKFDYQGSIYRSNAMYLSKSDAKRAESDKYKEVAKQVSNPSLKPILSLSEAINERLDTLLIKKSEKYYKESRKYLKQLLDYVGDVSIDTIKKNIINNVLLEVSKELQDRGCDNYAVNAMIRCYKAMFNQVIEDYELDIKNPCQGIDFYSIDIHLKYIPTDTEVEEVCALCNFEQKFLFEFVRDTAARIGEPLRMTGKDILADEVVLYTRKSKNSNLVPRKVPKPECLKNEKQYKPDELVFSYWNDTPKFLERKIEKLGMVNWSWHNLRHKKASQWSKEGKPLYEIMSLLGHSNLKTTQKYLQLLS